MSRAQSPLPESIVLYDGECGLCAHAVRWLMAHDRERSLYFAPLQGETAGRLREQVPGIPAGVESVVYVSGGRAHLRTKAFLHVARHLGRPWRWAYHLRWLPAWPLDLVYRAVARVRHRIAGRGDACRLPTRAERAQLLP